METDQITIRPCLDHEWSAAFDLLTRVYVGEGYVAAERARQFYTRENIDPAGTFLVATNGNAILGAVLLLHRNSPLTQVAGPDEAEFRILAVDPRGRGRGIGEKLVAECIERSARAPLFARAVVLWTRSNMTAAQRLYERLGFVRTPQRDALLPPLPIGPGSIERWVYCRPM